LSRAVTANADIFVTVNNVPQDPGVAYFVTNLNTLTFTGAPTLGTANITVVYRQYVQAAIAPAANTVTTSAIAANTIQAWQLSPGLFVPLIDLFTANGVGSTFTLSQSPINANSCTVTVNGLLQSSPSNYTVNQNTLIFTSNPAANSVIRCSQGTVVGTGVVPLDGSVSSSKLQSNLILTGNTTFTGNISSPSITVQTINSGTGNNLTLTGNTTFTGNVTVQGGLQVTGNVTTVNYETILYTETANVLTANSVTVSGNITSGNVTATTYYGNVVGTNAILSGTLAVNTAIITYTSSPYFSASSASLVALNNITGNGVVTIGSPSAGVIAPNYSPLVLNGYVPNAYSGTIPTQLVLNSSGADWAHISTVAPQVWQIGTTTSATGLVAGASAMQWNASGYVNFPNNPAFEAWVSGSVSNNSYILFNNIVVNTGSFYNASTGKFTAPIAGTYEFHWGSIGNVASDVYRCNLYKNGGSTISGVSTLETRGATGIQYPAVYRSFLVSLAAGDYVQIYYTADGGTALYSDPSAGYASFGGRLVG
jgi:cytoskeletal protein CcmA (bactofilin family)